MPLQHLGLSAPDDPLLTVEECALRLRVSTRAIHKWISAGVLPVRRYGLKPVLRIRVSDFVAFERGLCPNGTPEPAASSG